MLSQPNTLIDIFSGVTTDAYGDTMDNDTVATIESVPCALSERSQLVFPQNGATPMTVRMSTARVPNGTQVSVNDRIRDRNTNVFYSVIDTISNNNPVNTPDMKLDLSRIG